MKASEALQAGYDLLCQPGKRVRGVYASNLPPNAKGRMAEGAKHISADSPDAVCFCAIGVIHHIVRPNDNEENYALCGDVVHRLHKAAHIAGNGGIFWVNDSAPEVIFHKTWKYAIEKAKADEDVQIST